MSETVRLRNGATLPAPLAAALWDALQTVWREHPVALLELLTAYSDPDHVPHRFAVALLQQYGLLGPTGAVHEAVRDLLASALVGEGLDQQLGSPWADGTAGGGLV